MADLLADYFSRNKLDEVNYDSTKPWMLKKKEDKQGDSKPPWRSMATKEQIIYTGRVP